MKPAPARKRIAWNAKDMRERGAPDYQEAGERDGADLLEAILDRNNLNQAYKQVKRNHGAPGIDGMTVEEALPWLKEHKGELLESIREIQTPAGAAGGNPQTRWERRKEAGDTDGHRPHHPAGHRAETNTHLGTIVFRRQLRLPSETERPTGHDEGQGICRTGIHTRNRRRPVQILYGHHRP